MSTDKIYLASDNYAPAHPRIMEALLEANKGFAPSYGSDRWTEEAERLIQKAFKSQCKVFFVPSGTGSNVLALKLACRRHESVISTDIAHILTQETGAAESVVGCKLLQVPHSAGKVTVEGVLKRIRDERAIGKHSTSPRVLSITQPTEVGTVYSLEELSNLSKMCQQENLLLHMDGSRLYNAAVYLDISLHEIVEASSLDLLSLGGTKNGLLGAEALLIFNRDLINGSEHLHKQTLQLLSKGRYLSAQYIPFFSEKLWHSLASEANAKAKSLAAIIQTMPNLALSYPVETNQLFFTAPSSWLDAIQERIHCYLWDSDKNEIRWVTSWNTSDEEIQRVKLVLQEIETSA